MTQSVVVEAAIRPRSFDHVALWVDDRDSLAAFLCDHLGMHEISRTDAFTLVGVDAKLGKLTLFAAEGPREPGVLRRIVLSVADLDAALRRLPGAVAFEHEADGTAAFRAPAGVELGLVEASGPVDYDLHHVVLGVPEPASAGAGLERLGFARDADRYAVAGKHVELERAAVREGERPLLNHLALLVDSADAVQEQARRGGFEIADFVDAENTRAVFVWGPDRIKVEYVEHKPGFSLV